MSRLILVHISDLHIGSGLVGTVASSGLHGHGLLYCEKLELALQDIAAVDFPLPANEHYHYVVGGDLTRLGSDNDFYLAYGFLLNRWVLYDLQNQAEVGCRIPINDLVSVPGNHDHWNGFTPGWTKGRPPAYNPNVFPRFLDKTPWTKSIPAPENRFILELFGIDSNEGLRNKRTNLRARGEFSPPQNAANPLDPNDPRELSQLNKLLRESVDCEKKDAIPRIRAIVCHHAFNKGKQKGLAYARPLEPASLKELLEIAHHHGVAAILTGHTHDFEHKDYQEARPGGSNVLFELRCASTAQRDPQPEDQGFWVHEITLEDKQPRWNAWKYQYDRSPNVDRFAKDPLGPIPVR
jgi:hypothetical protein